MRNKGIRAICLTAVMCIFATTFAFADDSNTDTITDDTIVTRENIYAVAEHLGLEEDAVIEQDIGVSQSQLTVGQMKEMIASLESQPQTVISVEDAVMKDAPIVDIKTARVSGAKTVYCVSQITDDASVTYSATGQYYKSGSTKYWKSAVSSGISANGSNSPITYRVSKIYTNDLTLHNGYTSTSYLKLTYNYDITSYIGVSGASLAVSKFNVSGFQKFSGSTYL